MFKRKPKVVAPETIQQAQQDFNQVLFELGNVTYQRHLVEAEVTRLKAEANTKVQKLEVIAKNAQTLQARAKAELAETIKAGEASNDQEAPKAG